MAGRYYEGVGTDGGNQKLNPLKIKDELITKHGFYEYKVKELLLALAMGLRPANCTTEQTLPLQGSFS